ncbi:MULTISPECIES: SDR family NAD(P)-dependent oxidoreductase [Paenibacillus]|nr:MULTISPECIES: 3-oxoacyl-ACP reductase family protein [Paenibacillus]
MMNSLAGKVALVTGGSRGIGAAIARKLVRAGADVAITYVNSRTKADEVLADMESVGRRGLAIQADSAISADVEQAVKRVAETFGKLDILVNNAGIFPFGPIEHVSADEFDRTMAIHAKAVFVAIQTAVPYMSVGGRIISIGSCLADRVPGPGFSLYSMSKSALTGLTKGLARDLGPLGITVNVIHPGPIDTDMNPADGEGSEGEKSLTALGHYGTTDDIASMALHLAGQTGRFITGSAFAVDGGYAV